jgi:hypothetical protein
MAEIGALALRWLPYMLVPSEPESGRPRPEIWRYRRAADGSDWRPEDVEARWSIDAAFHNLATMAFQWHTWANLPASSRSRVASLDDITAWITLTKSVAGRLPFSDLANEMRHLAGRAERLLHVSTHLFDRVPSTLGTQRDANFRCSVFLWAIDELARAVNETEGEWARLLGVQRASLTTTKLWETLFANTTPAPSFADYKEAKKRIDRLQVKADRRAEVMRAVLHLALNEGPTGPDDIPTTPSK